MTVNTSKNIQISKTKSETLKRRKAQDIKSFELKINCHHTSKETYKKLNRWFKEAKWITNDVIASEDPFHYEYKDHRKVNHYDKDKNLIEEDITIQTRVHQKLVQNVCQNIVSLSKSKAKGNNVGKLHFRSQVNEIPLVTGQIKLKNKSQISIPGFSNLFVYGLDQLDKYEEYEVADGHIIKKASGYYVIVNICIYKEKRISTQKEAGLDFGIKDNITTSDGEKFNFNKQESDYLKYLMKQLKKKKKGSKRYWKLRNQIQKEYEHIKNQKDDYANKLVAYLLKEYDWIYFQDENLSKWKEDNHTFAKEIQGSILGRVKSSLVRLEGKRTTKVGKYVPTTKACLSCGYINENLTLNDRTFKCPHCGLEEDRDIHAAKNVLIFGSRKRTECLEQASAEEYVNSLALNTNALVNITDEAKTKKPFSFS